MSFIFELLQRLSADPVMGSVVMLLVAGIIGLGWMLIKLINSCKNQSQNHDKMVEKYTSHLIELVKEASHRDEMVATALNDIKVVLAEMRGKLN